MSSGRAWSGKCGASKATYSKNGRSLYFDACSLRYLMLLSAMAVVVP